MSVQLNCWQSFWNCICCGNCYDDPQKAEKQAQQAPLLSTPPSATTAVRETRRPQPPPQQSGGGYQGRLPPTMGLSVQQVGIQAGSRKKKVATTGASESDEREAPVNPGNEVRTGSASPKEKKAERVSASNEKAPQVGEGGLPLPDPAAFSPSSTPPKHIQSGPVHPDTPFVFRAQSRTTHQTQEEPSESVVSGPPPSSGGGLSTPVNSPMSDKSPSKVVDVTSHLHPTDRTGEETE